MRGLLDRPMTWWGGRLVMEKSFVDFNVGSSGYQLGCNDSYRNRPPAQHSITIREGKQNLFHDLYVPRDRPPLSFLQFPQQPHKLLRCVKYADNQPTNTSF